MTETITLTKPAEAAVLHMHGHAHEAIPSIGVDRRVIVNFIFGKNDETTRLLAECRSGKMVLEITPYMAAREEILDEAHGLSRAVKNASHNKEKKKMNDEKEALVSAVLERMCLSGKVPLGGRAAALAELRKKSAWELRSMATDLHVGQARRDIDDDPLRPDGKAVVEERRSLEDDPLRPDEKAVVEERRSLEDDPLRPGKAADDDQDDPLQ